MNRGRVVSLFGAGVLYFVSLYIYVPALPAFMAERTASLAAVGVALSMYGLWMAVLRMPLGIVTDVTGRSKPYLVGGVLLAGVGALIMGLGRSLGMLAFGRAVTGAAAAAWVPMMVVFAGFFPPERTIVATSLITLASSLGQMIGTGMTGIVESLGGSSLVFLAALGLSIAAAIVVVCTRIPRGSADHRGQVSLRSVLAIFGRRDVMVPSFTNALCQIGIWAVTFSFMPLLARRMGAGVVETGLLMTINIAANTAANLFMALAARRGNPRLILYGTFAASAAGALLGALAGSVPLLMVSAVVMGLANGVCFPILVGLSIQRVDAAHRSTAMGIHQSIYAIGMFAGPWIGGVLADALGIRGMFSVVAAFTLVAPAALISAYRHAPASVREKAAG